MTRHPMQANGQGTDRDAPDGVGGEQVKGRGPAGESGGAAYPNPHTGGDSEASVEGGAGKGRVEYFGGGQAGDDHSGGVAPNSPAGS